MTDHSQTAETATAASDFVAGQNRILAEPLPEADVFEIAHPHDAPVSAPHYAMKEKRKAGDYTPLDLLNEYVATESGWSLQDGKYVAAIHLDVDTVLQARLTIDEARAKSHAILTHTPHIQDILTSESTGRLNTRKNALATVLRPLGSVAASTADYEVVSGYTHGVPAVAYLVVNPEAVDMQHAAKAHHWSQQELDGMFPGAELQAVTPAKASRTSSRKDEGSVDPTHALREVFTLTANPFVGQTRDFMATHGSRKAIDAAAAAVTEKFSALGIAPAEYQVQVTGHEGSYSLSIEHDFRPRTQEEMKPIFEAGTTITALASTQPWTMKAIRSAPVGTSQER